MLNNKERVLNYMNTQYKDKKIISYVLELEHIQQQLITFVYFWTQSIPKI